MNKLLVLLFLGFVFINPLNAQKDKEEKKKWDVSNPGDEFNYKTHSFSTDEGTWMNLDVSPDG